MVIKHPIMDSGLRRNDVHIGTGRSLPLVEMTVVVPALVVIGDTSMLMAPKLRPRDTEGSEKRAIPAKPTPSSPRCRPTANMGPA